MYSFNRWTCQSDDSVIRLSFGMLLDGGKGGRVRIVYDQFICSTVKKTNQFVECWTKGEFRCQRFSNSRRENNAGVSNSFVHLISYQLLSSNKPAMMENWLNNSFVIFGINRKMVLSEKILWLTRSTISSIWMYPINYHVS